MTVSPVCFGLDPIKQTKVVILGLWLGTSGLLGLSGLFSRLLLLLLGELLSKQWVPPGLLGPCVGLLPCCPLLLLSVVIRKLLLSVVIVRLLLPVVIELLLPVVVVELLLSVVVGLLPVVLSVVLLRPVLLSVSSLPWVLLLPVEVSLELLLLRPPGGRLTFNVISYRSNVDVSCKAWYVLTTTVPSDCLGHPAVGHGVAAEQGLCGPVPETSLRAWAAVAAVPQVPPVTLAGGVGRPRAVGRAHRVDVTTGCAVKPAATVEEAGGAIAGDSWAEAGDLLLHARLMVNTPRNVRPGAVVLT